MAKGRLTKAVELRGEDGKVTFYHLTPAEDRLLEVLKDPAMADQTIPKICAKAKITPMTYYNCFGREMFRKAVRDAVDKIIYSSLLPVTNKLREKAIEFKDHHPARMVFEAADLLKGHATHATQINIRLGFERPVFSEPKDSLDGSGHQV